MRPARYKQLLRMFASLVADVANLSTCKRLKVGCILISQDLTTVYGFGYNGQYKGGPNKCDSDVPGSCGDIHAELNALLKVRVNDPSKIVVITTAPCAACAKCLINSGVSKVYYLTAYRSAAGLKLLKQANIPYEKL